MNDATGRNTARRRRADTIARCGRIMETARRLPLTRDVLAEAIERATPVQPDLMESRLDAEIASRERSKRVRLLKAAGFPNAKDIEGYDWSNLRMPADWGRAQLETLDFIDRCEDLVLYGPVGIGKTHLAVALGRLACMRAIPVRFFTATGLLMRLRRAKREDRLDTELRQIAKARLLIIDEFGYMPIDEEGSRLLFQVISDSYETRSVIYHEHRVLRLGTRARRQEHGRRADRPHRAPRQAHQIRGRLLPQRARPHDQITKKKAADPTTQFLLETSRLYC